jgi:hypothetical protein
MNNRNFPRGYRVSRTRTWTVGALAAAIVLLPQLAAAQAVAAASAAPEYPGTRSITLPGAPPSAGGAQPEAPHKAAAEPDPAAAVPAPQQVAASLALAQTAGAQDAEPHYQTAVLALKDKNLAVAADEMNAAAKLSPDNALVLYGLAVVEARNQQPELALPSIEKALQLGLPAKESAEAQTLIASIRYAIKKNEAEQKLVTPTKLWGSYEVPLDQPVQEFQERGGRTVFQSTVPVSRQMFLWKIDGASTIIGHWLETATRTDETIYKDSRRRDTQPKTITQESWWLVSILINPDGSLDGSRLQTCFRESGHDCDTGGAAHGREVTFKGHLEPDGDLTIVQDDGATLTLKKKSRVTTLPPTGVGIRAD